MQDLWKEKIDRDLPLSDYYLQTWNSLATDLQQALNTTVQEQFLRKTSEPGSDISVHVFVDASTKSYGAAAYISNNSNSKLVMAKNRIAPVKPVRTNGSNSWRSACQTLTTFSRDKRHHILA